MDLLIRAAAVLLLSSLIGILLRKQVPELSLLLSLASVCFVFAATLTSAASFRDFLDTIRPLIRSEDMLTVPVLKCLSIAVTTQIASELCRDASQGAASAVLEFMGTVCALSVAMPLLLSLVKTLGGLL
jgi:stage III sporulation protein AD